MKRKQLIATAAVLTMLAVACKKEKAGFSTVPPPPVLPGSTVIVNGISELTLERGDTGSIALVIALDSGKQEQIDLTLTGLPTDGSVTATLSAASGVPRFTSRVMFDVKSWATTGSHTLTLTAKSASGFTKTYTFKLNIVHPNECATDLAGNYMGSQICDTDTFTAGITAIPSSTKNRLQFSNFANRALTVTANVNCANNSIDVPKQVVNSGFLTYTIWGTGRFTDSTIVVTYRGESMFDTLNCTDTYMKQ